MSDPKPNNQNDSNNTELTEDENGPFQALNAEEQVYAYLTDTDREEYVGLLETFPEPNDEIFREIHFPDIPSIINGIDHGGGFPYTNINGKYMVSFDASFVLQHDAEVHFYILKNSSQPVIFGEDNYDFPRAIVYATSGQLCDVHLNGIIEINQTQNIVPSVFAIGSGQSFFGNMQYKIIEMTILKVAD